MRYSIVAYLVFMSAGIIISCGKDKAPTQKPEDDIGETYYSRNDSIFVKDVWMYLIQEPSYHLTRARQNIINEDIRNSIYEIRQVAAFILIEEMHAKSFSNDLLTTARKRLEKVADDLEGNKKVSMRDVDEIFARSLYVLARHYQLAATRYWNLKDAVETGYALKGAVLDLEKADVWAEHKMAVKDIEKVRLVTRLADEMIERGHYSGKAADQRIQKLHGEIEKFGRNNAFVTNQVSRPHNGSNR